MLHSGRRVPIVLVLALILVSRQAFSQQPAQPNPAWQKVKVGHTEGYIMPEEVARGLGLHRRDIPDEKNAATYYLQAIEKWVRFPDNVPEETYLLMCREPWHPEKFPAVAEWIRKNEEGFKLVEKAASLDECQFPIMMDKPGGTMLGGALLPQLAGMREFARSFVIRGHMLEAEGKHEEAIRDYLCLLKVASHAGQGEWLISGLVGIAVDAMALRAMERCVMRGMLEAQQLRDLLAALVEAEAQFPSLDIGLRAEEVQAMNFIERFLTAPDFILSGTVPEREAPAVQAFLSGRAWRAIMPDRTLKQDMRAYYLRMIALAQMPAWKRGAEDRQPELGIKPWNYPARLLTPVTVAAADRYAANQARLYGVVQVVALRLYWTDQGRYPDRLDELVPLYLPELPRDPFTGKPFIYVPMRDDFTLYSVGRDRQDNGGKAEAEQDIVFGTVQQ